MDADRSRRKPHESEGSSGASRDGVLILDAEGGVVVEATPFVAELLGRSREELVGRPVRKSGFLEVGRPGETVLETICRNGYVRRDGVPVKTGDGSRILVSVSGNSYMVDEKTMIQLNVCDVTARLRAEGTPSPEAARRDAHEVARLAETARLEADDLLRSLTVHARDLLRADAAELCLYRRDRGVLERAYALGVGLPGSSPELYPGEGLAGRVWERGETIVVRARGEWPRGGERDEPPPGSSAVCAPICWRDEVLGALTLLSYRERAFSEPEARLAELFAGQAAVTVVAARLSEEMQALSLFDELTGVFNRRGLLTLGAREVERARRLARPLSLLFIDLDHFSDLNDRYSHAAGDGALQEVCRSLLRGIRRIDVAARYGGEEFVVLLVETDLGPAFEVGERLRREIEGLSLVTGRGPARVTVSIGVAGRGPKTTDLEALIHRGDEAMYAAKQAGRNRVVALPG